MPALALASARNRGDDLELWHANRVGNVLFVLTQETPENCRKPVAQPGTEARIDVVLVVPGFVGELVAFHSQRDRDDDVGEPLTEVITSRVALVAQAEVRVGRRPA